MREFMPYTHADPATVRRYADREVSFDDIAEDRGPRLMNTFDVLDSATFAHLVRQARRATYPPPDTDKYQETDDDA